MPGARAARRWTRRRSIARDAKPCRQSCASSTAPASTSATTASSSAIRSSSISRRGCRDLAAAGSGSRDGPSRADVDRYPDFKRMWIEQHASTTQVSALGGLPKAIGEVRYLDDRAINDECRDFNAVLADHPGVFVEPFMSAPSPGILATAVRNEHYDT